MDLSLMLHRVEWVARHNDSDTKPHSLAVPCRPEAVFFPMTTIVRLSVENASPGADRWAAVASTIQTWGAAQGVVLRDAVVLLPFAQLLPEARRAFAKSGGWMPRIETTKTLSA